jgi:hypothetical protein
MLTCNRLEAGGSKLEDWLTVADFFAEPQASCLKLISALADGLMLVSQHPVKVRLAPRDSRALTLAFQESRL